MTGMLASVTNLQEAQLAAKAGVDIIDLKDPGNGVLGALDTEQVREIRQQFGMQTQFSATIGDLPLMPRQILRAVRNMADTGVNFVKIGFFPGGEWKGTIDLLAKSADDGTKLVAVFFGDISLDTKWIDHLAHKGFTAAMIDTMNKSKGSLTKVCSSTSIKAFVEKVKSRHLLCGLAGSLRLEDIPYLIEMAPDYLGFRGALCVKNERTNRLDASAVSRIRNLINSSLENRFCEVSQSL